MNGELRDRKIDALNGIGILLVVMGHYDYQVNSQALFDWIFSFHMPLFFMSGGYLWGNKEKEYIGKGMIHYTKKQIYQLIVPYIFFFFLSFLGNGIIMGSVHNRKLIHITIEDCFILTKALVTGGGYLQFDLVKNLPLWFLQLYFIAKILFFLLHYIKQYHAKLVYILNVCIFLFMKPFQDYLFYVRGEWPGPVFHISALPAALVFMEIGCLLYQYRNQEVFNKILQSASVRGVAIFLLAGFGITVSYFYPGSVAHIQSYWYVVGACATVLSLFILLSDYQPVLLCYWGRNSLIILGLHGPVLGFHRSCLQSLVFPKWNGFILYLINVVIVMVMLTICIIVWLKMKSVINSRIY